MRFCPKPPNAPQGYWSPGEQPQRSRKTHTEANPSSVLLPALAGAGATPQACQIAQVTGQAQPSGRSFSQSGGCKPCPQGARAGSAMPSEIVSLLSEPSLESPSAPCLVASPEAFLWLHRMLWNSGVWLGSVSSACMKEACIPPELLEVPRNPASPHRAWPHSQFQPKAQNNASPTPLSLSLLKRILHDLKVIIACIYIVLTFI